MTAARTDLSTTDRHLSCTDALKALDVRRSRDSILRDYRGDVPVWRNVEGGVVGNDALSLRDQAPRAQVSKLVRRALLDGDVFTRGQRKIDSAGGGSLVEGNFVLVRKDVVGVAEQVRSVLTDAVVRRDVLLVDSDGFRREPLSD